MKIVVLAKDICITQWLGRLLNEAGFSADHDDDCEVVFVNSISEAIENAKDHVDDRCFTLVWSGAVSGVDLMRAPGFHGYLLLISAPECSDRLILDQGIGTCIQEKDLTAVRLREILDAVHA